MYELNLKEYFIFPSLQYYIKKSDVSNLSYGKFSIKSRETIDNERVGYNQKGGGTLNSYGVSLCTQQPEKMTILIRKYLVEIIKFNIL